MGSGDGRWNGSVLVASLVLVASWAYALWGTPVDEAQGEVYRIMYLHVPVAIVAFALAYVLLGASLWSLIKNSQAALHIGKASCELGVIFTVLCLFTGSVWGRPTWNVWWTWDARITTTFLLALLFAGYLLLYDSIEDRRRRQVVCAILGIIIAVDVPIIYKSVTWWRTLHQPQSVFREQGASMEPEMLAALAVCFAATLIFAGVLVAYRASNLNLALRIEAQNERNMESL